MLCFCGTVDLIVFSLKSDRSKFCKLRFGRNHGYKNQARVAVWRALATIDKTGTPGL